MCISSYSRGKFLSFFPSSSVSKKYSLKKEHKLQLIQQKFIKSRRTIIFLSTPFSNSDKNDCFFPPVSLSLSLSLSFSLYIYIYYIRLIYYIKIYNTRLLNRIKPEIEKMYRKNQSDFRRNRSITLQILTIYRILEVPGKKTSFGLVWFGFFV